MKISLGIALFLSIVFVVSAAYNQRLQQRSKRSSDVRRVGLSSDDSVADIPLELEEEDVTRNSESCPGRSDSFLRPESPPVIYEEPIALESAPLELEIAELEKRRKRDTMNETSDLDTYGSAKNSGSEFNTSEVLDAVNLAHEVDLCFLVDVTGSMSPYIIGVRDSINDIVDDLLNSSMSSNYVEDLRISFVGYRDFADKEDQFTILPFTQNVTEFRDFVAQTHASGGYNIPEDVFGGLDSALNLEWGNSTRTRLIFHIADAPGHGCDLHLLASDDFPGGDPKERTAQGLFDRLKKMNIEYFFGNITADTDTMIAKFSEVNGSPVRTFDIGVSADRGGVAYGIAGEYEADSDGLRAAAAPLIYESVRSAVEASISDKRKR